MVRINIIEPSLLADQHLIAEYNEILMLLGHARKHPDVSNISEEYLLGPGHIRFFKNKLVYIAKRHKLISAEMRRRGFRPLKVIELKEFHKHLLNDWQPKSKDFLIIKSRLREKLKMKPGYYRYYGEKKPTGFFLKLLEQ